MRIIGLYERYCGKRVGGTTGYKPRTSATKDWLDEENSNQFAMYLKQKKIAGYRTKVMNYIMDRKNLSNYKIDSLLQLLLEIYEYDSKAYEKIINLKPVKDFLDAIDYVSLNNQKREGLYKRNVFVEGGTYAFNPDQNTINKILDMYEKPGNSMSKISKELDIPLEKIQQIIVRNQDNLEFEPKEIPVYKSSPNSKFATFRKYKPSEVEDIIQMYKSGVNIAQIASKYNDNAHYIRRNLTNLGIYDPNIDGRKILTPSDIKDIVKMYKSGVSIYGIATKYGVNHNTIKDMLVKQGVYREYTREPNEKPFSPSDIEDIVEMYKSGVIIYDIATKYGVHHNTIKGILVKQGVYGKNRRELDIKPFSPSDIEDIIEMYKSGVSIRKIAAKYNVSVTIIKDRLIKQGVYEKYRRIPNEKSFSPSKIKEIIEMYEANVEIAAIARVYGVRWENIRDILISYGAYKKKRTDIPERKLFTPLEMEDIIKMYKSGVSIEKIATKYGVGWSTIKNKLMKHGVYDTSKSSSAVIQFTPFQMKTILRMYRLGMSMEKIAEKYGVSWQTIRDRLMKHGIQSKDRGGLQYKKRLS